MLISRHRCFNLKFFSKRLFVVLAFIKTLCYKCLNFDSNCSKDLFWEITQDKMLKKILKMEDFIGINCWVNHYSTTSKTFLDSCLRITRQEIVNWNRRVVFPLQMTVVRKRELVMNSIKDWPPYCYRDGYGITGWMFVFLFIFIWQCHHHCFLFPDTTLLPRINNYVYKKKKKKPFRKVVFHCSFVPEIIRTNPSIENCLKDEHEAVLTFLCNLDFVLYGYFFLNTRFTQKLFVSSCKIATFVWCLFQQFLKENFQI